MQRRQPCTRLVHDRRLQRPQNLSTADHTQRKSSGPISHSNLNPEPYILNPSPPNLKERRARVTTLAASAVVVAVRTSNMHSACTSARPSSTCDITVSSTCAGDAGLATSWAATAGVRAI